MVNKYFKAARALIFWMGLYCLICKPVPTTTAFQKRCQIYYKGELEQNSSLAMHRGHYANTTREHISQSISSPLEKPPPNCLSCGEPSPPPPRPHPPTEPKNGCRTFPVFRKTCRYHDRVQDGAKKATLEMQSVQESFPSVWKNQRWHQSRPRRWSGRGCGAARRYGAGDGRLSSPTLS